MYDLATATVDTLESGEGRVHIEALNTMNHEHFTWTSS